MSIGSLGNVASLAAQLFKTSHSDPDPCGTPVPGHHGPLGHLVGSVLDKVALNPQPLPPHEGGALLSQSAKFADEYCGTVPHKVPHWPPPPPEWSSLAGIAAKAV